MQLSQVQRVLLFILSLNILVAVLKAIFGLLANSMSMVADAFHSSFDSVSNIVAIIASFIAAKPPDEQHQYGHGKFETLGALAIGALILLTACWIVFEGYVRLTEGVVPEITIVTVGVMLATLAVNVLVFRYEYRKGQELDSYILIADSTHTRSDVYVSISVLAGFAAVTMGFPQADPLIAFAIGILIARMGVEIIREAGKVLSDSAFLQCEAVDIEEIVMGIESVKGCHNFRCRGKPGEMYGDIHVTVDPALSVDQGHEIATEVERRLKEEIGGIKEIIVHIEPEEHPDGHA
ncbi:MAG: cation diffusion facilitator family transporter [Methanomicrobiaceae archaeon]|uniref:Cobalt-zinc-cadmium resistance protein n=1 Tax=hydrocarbon metagenome TaxID=938273 RepID=A0A0W8FE00_9ZZZZ|nr:cation diffusion facilitator family transporter [Methanomicrobiaceae archaeon]MDD5419267.1 cation diffusion facilitator family transporter [Methanomicrobiaceae archaeon]